MPFDLSDYEPVEERLAKFWSDNPDGSINTEIVHHGTGYFIVRAEVWRDFGDASHADATGLASETVTERGVNATSALENCETSAIGRALANLGYAPKGRRPSREEMSKTRPASEARTVPADTTGSGGDDTSAPSQDREGLRAGSGVVTAGGEVHSGEGADPSAVDDNEVAKAAEILVREAAWEEFDALTGSRAKSRGLLNTFAKLHITARTEDEAPIDALIGATEHFKLRGIPA